MKKYISLYTSAGVMGEDEAKAIGFLPSLVIGERRELTTAEDTKRAAEYMAREGVDLMAFCGGDGTARDLAQAINMKIPVLGIPAGVKMHSAVFSINPREAARIVVKFFSGEISTKEAEVMDIDENEFRKGRLSARLYGYLLVPFEEFLVQQVKASSPQTEDEVENQKAIAKQVSEEMKDDWLYIIGPGTTTRAVSEALGLEKTLLGVDAMYGRKLLAKDANEKQLLQLMKGKKTAIIVTPIGGQAYVFGRGNQQISPAVIEKAGKENITVIATKRKLLTLEPRRLLVDTGSNGLDEKLRGYVKVVTGYREETVIRIE